MVARKNSFGTTSEYGERWLERSLSLRMTCKLRRRRKASCVLCTGSQGGCNKLPSRKTNESQLARFMRLHGELAGVPRQKSGSQGKKNAQRGLYCCAYRQKGTWVMNSGSFFSGCTPGPVALPPEKTSIILPQGAISVAGRDLNGWQAVISAALGGKRPEGGDLHSLSEMIRRRSGGRFELEILPLRGVLPF